MRRHRLNKCLVLVLFSGSKSCPSSMDITGIRIATQKLRDFPTFHVSPPLSETVPPPGATAAN